MRSLHGHTLVGAALALIVTGGAWGGSVIHVDDDAPNDPGPGNPLLSDPLEDGSPGHPFDAIQEAIDVAVDRDEVLVADGTYTGPGNRDMDFGGRLITVCSENGADTCVIDCQGSAVDPHRGFQFQSSETNEAVVAGFTITNGYVVGAGGAIFCIDSGPAIVNCLLTGNTAASAGNPFGGAIYVNSGEVLISNCTVSGNATLGLGGGGGGIFLSSGTVVGCTVAGNVTEANNGAGGIYAANATISDCIISDNVARRRAGGVELQDGLIDNCTIIGNQCVDAALGQGGGGVHAIGGTIRNSVIAGNSCDHLGGGISAQGFGGGTLIINCTVSGNSAQSGGGGLFGLPAAAVNCTIIGNTTPGNGGGVLAWYTSAITNCTISANSAGGHGGGIAAEFSSSPGVAARNTIVWQNTAPLGPQLAVVDGLSEILASYCNVQGGQAAVYVARDGVLTWGDGNIDIDPLFDDTDGHLSPDSPCIEAGWNWALPADALDLDDDGNTEELLPIDLDANARVASAPPSTSPACGGAPRVDMGAYEAPGVPVEDFMFADIDADGMIAVTDLLVMLGAWGNIEICPLADLDGDGEVATADLLILLGAWDVSS